MRKPLEKDIQRACLQWLQLNGLFCWRNNTTGVYDPTRKKFRTFTGLKGVSDILGIAAGRLLAIEVKRPGERPTPDQVYFLERITAHGGLAIVVHSVDDLEKAFALEGIIP